MRGGAGRTVVDGLVLLHAGVVAVEDGAQAVTDLGHDLFAGRLELGQVVGLLDQGV